MRSVLIIILLVILKLSFAKSFIYECDFKATTFGITCELISFNASSPNKAAIIGNNPPELNTKVDFFYSDSVIFPRFPNLVIFSYRYSTPESVAVTNASLDEIWRSDLEQIGEDLKNLWLDFNEIEKIPGNLFENCQNLELVSFKGNKIKEVGSELFTGLQKLKTIKFKSNFCYSPPSNATKSEIKKEIKANCKVRNPEFTKMKEDEMEVKATVTFASVQWNNYHLQEKLESKRLKIRHLEELLADLCNTTKID